MGVYTIFTLHHENRGSEHFGEAHKSRVQPQADMTRLESGAAPPQCADMKNKTLAPSNIDWMVPTTDPHTAPTPNFATAFTSAHANSETDFAFVSRELAHLHFSWLP